MTPNFDRFSDRYNPDLDKTEVEFEREAEIEEEMADRRAKDQWRLDREKELPL